MAESEDILIKEFKAIQQELIAKHQDLGMSASGLWQDSLEVDVKRTKGVIWGEPYTEQLVNGREPGKFPPIKAIEEWILDKNIPIFGDISISSLAFLIARKIANEGTEYFKQGGTDLVEAVITPRRIQDILDKVSEFQINSFVSEIQGVFQKMAA